jgi:hypothetical protein
VQLDGEALLELDDRCLAEDVCVGVGAHRKVILKCVAELRDRAAGQKTSGNTAARQGEIEAVMVMSDSVAKRELIAVQQEAANLRSRLETAQATMEARAGGLGGAAMLADTVCRPTTPPPTHTPPAPPAPSTHLPAPRRVTQGAYPESRTGRIQAAAAATPEELFQGGMLRLSVRLPTGEYLRMEAAQQLLVSELKVRAAVRLPSPPRCPREWRPVV